MCLSNYILSYPLDFYLYLVIEDDFTIIICDFRKRELNAYNAYTRVVLRNRYWGVCVQFDEFSSTTAEHVKTPLSCYLEHFSNYGFVSCFVLWDTNAEE